MTCPFFYAAYPILYKFDKCQLKLAHNSGTKAEILQTWFEFASDHYKENEG